MNMIPIVFTINRKFLPPTYVAIASLLANAKEDTKYDIIVFYQGNLRGQVKLLYQLVKDNRHNMSIREIPDLSNQSFRTSRTWPSIVYVKMYLPTLLLEYDKIIFSDVDVFFCGDLSEVYFSTDLENYDWAGVIAEKNDENARMHQFFIENSHEYIYMNGFMLMNLSRMREMNWVDRCEKNLKRFEQRLHMFDLEIFNITATEIRKLPFRYVCLQSIYDMSDITKTSEYGWLAKVYPKEELESEKEKTVVIHYAGKVGTIGKIWWRIRPAEYYNAFLKKIPFLLT